MQLFFKFTMSEPKSVLWSLICFPLGLVICIIGCLFLHSEHYRGMGLIFLGLYTIGVGQEIWSGFARREPGQKLSPGDIGYLATCTLGILCLFALIFGSFSAGISEWLEIASVLFLVFSDDVGKICQAIDPRSLRVFRDEG